METCLTVETPIPESPMGGRQGWDLVWGGGALTLVFVGCAVALWRSYLRARAFARGLESLLEAPLGQAPREGTPSGILPARMKGTVRVPADLELVSPVSGRRCGLFEVAWREGGRARRVRFGEALVLASESGSAWVGLDEAAIELAFRPVPVGAVAAVRELLPAPLPGAAPNRWTTLDPYRARSCDEEEPTDLTYREIAAGEPLVAIGVVRGDPMAAHMAGPYRMGAEMEPEAELGGARGAPLVVLPAGAPLPAVPQALLPLASWMTALAVVSALFMALHRLPR